MKEWKLLWLLIVRRPKTHSAAPDAHDMLDPSDNGDGRMGMLRRRTNAFAKRFGYCARRGKC